MMGMGHYRGGGVGRIKGFVSLASASLRPHPLSCRGKSPSPLGGMARGEVGGVVSN